MKRLTMEELRDLAPAYVMNTLSPDERDAFDAALADSPELARDVADHRLVVERLSTGQTMTPSPSVRTRFLERIAEEKTVPLTPSVASSVTSPARAPAGSATAPDTASQRSSMYWWTTGVLGIALAASIVFSVNLNSELSVLRARQAAVDSTLIVRDQALAAEKKRFETVLGAEKDLVVVRLATQSADSAGMQLFWNVRQGRGLLSVFRLPPASRGRAYELWLIRDGKAVPVHVFNSDADGRGLESDIVMPTDTRGITLMAVTLEPEGGSQQPTSVPFMTGTLATQ